MKRLTTIAALLLSLPTLHAYNWGNGCSLEAEALYWSVSDNFPLGVTVAMSETVSESITGFRSDDTFVNVNLKKPRDHWEPGVRLGFGWNGCDCIDVKGVYTWYYNSNVDHFNENIDVQWPFADFTRTINYNVGDVEWGKTFDFSSVTLRPFCGLRSAWINQNHKALFTGFSETVSVITGDVEVPEPLEYKLANTVWGIGPRLGLDTTWGNFYGISLLTNASFAALYGRETFDLRVYVTGSSNDGVTVTEDVTIIDLRNAFWQLVPSFQMFFGLSWKHCNLQAKAGWESIIYWETGNILVLDKSLTMQGLTASLQYSF